MPKGKATSPALMPEERAELEKLVRRRKTAQDLALRARIVLRCAVGATNQAVAGEAGVCVHTVGKRRERFARDRLDGLRDEPRSGAPRTVTDERVAELLVRTLEATPADATHWSTRAMAAACGLSPATVQRVWHAFGPKPHRVGTFKPSADPEFAAKVRDIVGLYLSPPTRSEPAGTRGCPQESLPDRAGATGWTADLGELVAATLAPYAADPARVTVEAGPAVALVQGQVTPVCLILHELATNAAKHGALSGPAGRVRVNWRKDDEDAAGDARRLRLRWEEQGGPEVRPAAGRPGFGTRLVEAATAQELHGRAELTFAPEGLQAEIAFPIG